jgi:hypothetical protein
MTMPTFTAEASLYKMSAQYNSTLITSLTTRHRNVIPQSVLPLARLPLAQRLGVIGNCEESCCFLTPFCICCCEQLPTGPACSCLC